ncbi:hypothetical protein TH53_24105 [Pedobacter lusitanus]|uniref:Uncharacterized protein n=1 Tax=Pedobacter lusitanus TaxID=1503925 RepID=A0A0D0GFD8_9SPHI|nr:hypothetical protein [Pedobacter lusitanus]KIO74845.1 hypothetical protein TH53_24105 [Pedobacter lusitanus]
MKKNVLLPLVLGVFTFILLPQESFSQERVKIFNIKFNAVEVTGQNRFSNGTQWYQTAIPSQLSSQKNDEYFYSLGSFRPDFKKTETLDLFNLSLQNSSFPFLDAIDFDYYKSYGIGAVESNHPEVIDDVKYLKLKSYIVDSVNTSIADKKKILFATPKLIKDYILLSRYEIITNQFSVDKKKVKQATANLVAQLDTIKVSNNAELSAKVKAYFSSLSDESTVLKGIYIDARLHPAYIAKIEAHISNADLSQIGNDQFSRSVKRYVNSDKAAANTALVAIRLDGTFDKTKINIQSIASDLTGKFQIPAADALKIAATVNLTFSNNETTTFKNKFNNTFIVRYFTSSIIDGLAFQGLKKAGR